jgi:tetratricopeptide (TPR) repeat protein
MRRQFVWNTVLVLAVGAVVVLGLALVRAHSGLRKAERLAEHGLWDAARIQLTAYLRLHPRDGKARLLFAEALVRDDHLPARESVPVAIEHLRQVPDDSAYAAQARTEEGRLEFLVMHKPAAAERLFRRACELNPEFVDPYYMLWKLFEVTGRAHLASEVFWKAHDLAPPEQRSLRLSEWYTSQFYLETATKPLDQRLGFLAEPGESLSRIEARRFLRFRETEPSAPLGHAALANWFRFSGQPKDALQVLDEAAKVAERPMSNDFFAGTLVGTLIDLGEFDRAERHFDEWPANDHHYEYLLNKALVLDEIKEESAQAREYFERALAQWPGPVDWRTRYRYANCLARLGRQTEANEARERAQQIEQSMGQQVHAPVREALRHLDNPEALEEIVAFYKQLGCVREAQAWQDEITRLRSSLAKQFPISTK